MKYIISLLVLSFIILGFDLVARKEGRRWKAVPIYITLIGLIACGFLIAPDEIRILKGFSNDPLARFMEILILVAGILGALAFARTGEERMGERVGEYCFLLVLSIMGMSILVGASDLLLVFVSFELMSLPLYAMAGFMIGDERGVEASMKFLIVGVISSAMMFYGISLVYGCLGTTSFTALKGEGLSMLSVLGLVLIMAGFGFKIATVPFHAWLPDVYEGAPTPLVAFLSMAPKGAGLVALIRILSGIFPDMSFIWAPILAGLSAVSMIVGNYLALAQRNIKRLLAYSSIAHIGYMLVGLAAANGLGITMILFYLATYLFANMGAFMVVEVVSRAEGSEEIECFRGLATRSPLLALSMLLFLLSLGGIPFMAGFWAKLYVFLAGVKGGLIWLVLLGAVLAIVALYYYLMVARRMYIEPSGEKGRVDIPLPLAIGIAVCIIGVVVPGIFPGFLVRLSEIASSAIF
jgi:NADH-quinone oxidoreductase subunit N